MTSRPVARLFVGLLLVGACGKPTTPPPRALPAFELHDVVDTTVAALEGAVAAASPPLAAAPNDLDEQVEGLVVFLSSASGQMADAAFDDVTRLGDVAIAPLHAALLDTARVPDQRRAALRLIGELKTPAAVDVLTAEAGGNPEGSIRALAAWKLGSAGDDACVPALLRQLKYEKAPEAVPWMARTLAAYGNFAGAKALNVLATWQGPGGEAAMHLAQLAQDAGFADEGRGVNELIAAWEAGDPEGLLKLSRPHGDRWRLAVWHWIQVFEEFQLRGVDDGRFVLSSMGPDAAHELSLALHDENRYVRTHVAQSLGRMGPRGRGAAAALAEGLGEPILAPYAAEALGAVCARPRMGAPALDVDARALLEDCTLVGRDPGLRLAAVRALGVLGDPASEARLDVLSREEGFPELQQAATESLAGVGSGQRVAARLVAFARRSDLDPGTSLRALRTWIGKRALAGDEWARTLATDWDALAPSLYVAPTAEENATRLEARLALVEAALAQLAPEPAP